MEPGASEFEPDQAGTAPNGARNAGRDETAQPPEPVADERPADGDASPIDQPSIGRELSIFVRHVEALNTSFGLVNILLWASVKVAGQAHLAYLEKHGTLTDSTPKSKTFSLDALYIYEASILRRKHDRTVAASRIVPRSFLVALVSQFDVFLGRFLRCIYSARPELLNASDRQLTFSELTSFGSISAARDYLLEKEVESLLRKSHTDQFAWLENTFKVSLRRDLAVWPAFIELTERRNLFVHTNGLVSSQYLDVCLAHHVVHDGPLAVGTQLDSNAKYFAAAHRAILEIGIKLAQVLWRKLLPDQLSLADASLISLTYDLLASDQVATALPLLAFACNTLKKHSNDHARRTLVVNFAQAQKWAGDEKECKRIIDTEDWSACGDAFALAIAVLSDDFVQGAAIMRRIGKDGAVTEPDYKAWPLFRKFRESSEFAEAFSALFGRPSIEVPTPPEEDLRELNVSDMEEVARSIEGVVPDLSTHKPEPSGTKPPADVATPPR